MAPNSYTNYAASCSSGGQSVSGSFYQATTVMAWLNESFRDTSTTWTYSITNGSSGGFSIFFVTLCAL